MIDEMPLAWRLNAYARHCRMSALAAKEKREKRYWSALYCKLKKQIREVE
ncbi:hypothetical protein [Pseudoroseomonas ludipueritiae]|uniref:Transposase n=1 Tax=Pseudoroseomonas ludipueritiae TaxID=198093 RepID=A0ABR7REW2_9PROT|nr:hypothetical protein [Pseudoroseomonas ludipueritiae]MBC9180218.1 hypothetical protein [Pseudoroseomonas ludipueritiae]